MFTTLTEKEIKELIDEHRKTISKLENQRSLIAFLVLLTLISVFLLSIVGNILLTIFSFIIGSLVLLFLISVFPKQSNTEQLEYEIEELNKLLAIRIEDEIKRQEIDERTIYDVVLKVKGISYHQESFSDLCQELIKEADDAPYLGCTAKEIKEELIFSDRFYKYSPFELSDVDFVPEMDNQFDPNAVKIVVRGYHLGYVTKSKNRKVLRLTADSNNEVIKIAKIYGGDYKDIDPESDKLRTVKDSFKIQIKLKVLRK
ncbi:HIRAN domain-containing protein [Streptococcus australis]|uniref:HIRAN domain-containing protein n=1 Tax=Streptococcus TaxID=1301 RepID=UPI000F65C8E3|nr:MULTISPECIES: HIRAN domain-containing protein [Streptococcus]MBZ2153524.1 HIRAN domain-containing protein [Streptococcus australis]RSK01673.1 hypothetical protein D8783_05020 [Streptococcus sp. A12]